MSLFVGDTVCGRYSLTQLLLAQSGFEAWIAQDSLLSQPCQLYVVTDSMGLSAVNEIASELALSNNPAYVKVLQLQRFDSASVIVTALDQGYALSSLVSRGTQYSDVAIRSIIAWLVEQCSHALERNIEFPTITSDIVRLIVRDADTAKSNVAAVGAKLAGNDASSGWTPVNAHNQPVSLSGQTSSESLFSLAIADASITPLLHLDLRDARLSCEMNLIRALSGILYELLTGKPYTRAAEDLRADVLQHDFDTELVAICSRGLRVPLSEGRRPVDMVRFEELMALLGDYKPIDELTTDDIILPASLQPQLEAENKHKKSWLQFGKSSFSQRKPFNFGKKIGKSAQQSAPPPTSQGVFKGQLQSAESVGQDKNAPSITASSHVKRQSRSIRSGAYIPHAISGEHSSDNTAQIWQKAQSFSPTISSVAIAHIMPALPSHVGKLPEKAVYRIADDIEKAQRLRKATMWDANQLLFEGNDVDQIQVTSADTGFFNVFDTDESPLAAEHHFSTNGFDAGHIAEGLSAYAQQASANVSHNSLDVMQGVEDTLTEHDNQSLGTQFTAPIFRDELSETTGNIAIIDNLDTDVSHETINNSSGNVVSERQHEVDSQTNTGEQLADNNPIEYQTNGFSTFWQQPINSAQASQSTTAATFVQKRTAINAAHESAPAVSSHQSEVQPQYNVQNLTELAQQIREGSVNLADLEHMTEQRRQHAESEESAANTGASDVDSQAAASSEPIVVDNANDPKKDLQNNHSKQSNHTTLQSHQSAVRRAGTHLYDEPRKYQRVASTPEPQESRFQRFSRQLIDKLPLSIRHKFEVTTIIVIVFAVMVAIVGGISYALLNGQSRNEGWPSVDESKVMFMGSLPQSDDAANKEQERLRKEEEAQRKRELEEKKKEAEVQAKASATAYPIASTTFVDKSQDGGIGYGFYVRLTQPQEIHRVEVSIRQRGASAQLYVGGTPADPQHGSPLGDFSFGDDGHAVVNLKKIVKSQDIMIWLTQLPQGGLYFNSVKVY